MNRRRWSLLLVVLGSVIASVSALTTWVRTEMLDTDQWVSVSEELLAEPEVQQAIATYLTNTLYDNVDVEAQLADLLPTDLSGLAGPLSGLLRTPIEDGIDQLVGSSWFNDLWTTANREAHQLFVAVLRDDTPPGISTSDGRVELELTPLLRSVGERVGIPTSALDRIPDDAGNVEIFQSDELAAVQATVRVLDFLSWFLIVVVLVLYAAAIAVASGFRRHALRNVGVGLVIAGAALLVLRRLGVRAVVGITVDPSHERLADLVADVATELLRQTAWTGIIYGLLIIGFAWLLGPHRWAVGVREPLGRFGDSTAAVAVGAAFAVLLVVWWSPGRAFDTWWSALLLIALAIGGVVVLMRQVAAEQRARTIADPVA